MKKLTSLLCAACILMNAFPAEAMLRTAFRALLARRECEGTHRLVRGLRTQGREPNPNAVLIHIPKEEFLPPKGARPVPGWEGERWKLPDSDAAKEKHAPPTKKETPPTITVDFKKNS